MSHYATQVSVDLINRFIVAGWKLTDFNIGDGIEPIQDWVKEQNPSLKTDNPAVIGADIVTGVELSALRFERGDDYVGLQFGDEIDPRDESMNGVYDFNAKEELHKEIESLLRW